MDKETKVFRAFLILVFLLAVSVFINIVDLFFIIPSYKEDSKTAWSMIDTVMYRDSVRLEHCHRFYDSLLFKK